MPVQLTAAALWLNTFFAAFDESVAILEHKLYQIAGPVMSPIMEFISFLGNDGICLIIISVLLMIPKKTRPYGTAMLLGLAIGALFTNLWLKVVIARPRPYVDETKIFHQIWMTMGQHMESDKSFPSGHTTAAFASMVPLFIMGKKNISWLALVFAVLMGISRIYLGVHYASDVIGGIIVGSLAGLIGYFVASKLPAIYYNYKLQLPKR